MFGTAIPSGAITSNRTIKPLLNPSKPLLRRGIQTLHISYPSNSHVFDLALRKRTACLVDKLIRHRDRVICILKPYNISIGPEIFRLKARTSFLHSSITECLRKQA